MEELNLAFCKLKPFKRRVLSIVLTTISNRSLIKQDLSRGIPLSMTQQSLAQLLKHNNVPPEFVEILVNNNGAYTSSVQYREDGNTPEHIRTASTIR
jgi:hypothetical protein